MKTLICLAILGCPNPTPARVALYLSGQFDAATTYRALTACPRNWTCWEVNPLLKPFARDAMIFPAIAVGDGLVLGLTHRYGRNHRVLRKVVIWGFVGLHIWCAVHNIRMAGGYPGNPPAVGGRVYSVPQAQGIVRFK